MLKVKINKNSYLLKTSNEDNLTKYTEGDIVFYKDDEYIEKEDIFNRLNKYNHDLDIEIIDLDNVLIFENIKDEDNIDEINNTDNQDDIKEKVNLHKMKNEDLKKILDKAGIKYKRNNCKSELVTLINLHQLEV